MLNPDDLVGKKNNEVSSDSDSSSDEEERDNSLESINEKCQTSPMHSLDLELFSQPRSYEPKSQYVDSWTSSLCCNESRRKEDHPSKTIKAATLELSSPRILHRAISSDKAASSVFGNGWEEETIAVKDNKISLSYDEKYTRDSDSTLNKHKTTNLQARRKKTQGLKSEFGDNTQTKDTNLKLSLFPSHFHKSDDPAWSASPTERQQFFKSFAHLIHKKENKLHNVVCCNELSFKVNHNSIWNELMAWYHGCSVDEVKNLLNLERQAIPIVVEEVCHFSVNYKDSEIVENSDIEDFEVIDKKELGLDKSLKDSGHSSLTDFINEDPGVMTLKQDFVCDCSDTLSRICQNCVNQTTSALHQVESLLKKVDHIESLYPSNKSLCEDYPVCNGRVYVCCLKTLHSWLNITKDLRLKITVLAKLLGIKDKSKVGWPCYENIIADDPSQKCDAEVNSSTLSALSPARQSHLKIDLMSSPNTSGSDRSEQSKGSFPSSPDVQASNPFDLSKSSAEASAAKSFSPYHKYVDHMLRHKGLRYMHKQLFALLGPILYRVHAALKKPKPKFSTETTSKVVINHGPSQLSLCNLGEASLFGVWSSCFQIMALPTFHKSFFFLMRVLLDVVHECLQLRLEQQPAKPSPLSVGQLIKECKEVLKAATGTRRKYVNLAQTVLGESGNDIIEAQLDAFNSDLDKMLQVYLGYLECKMLLPQNISHTLRQKSYLEEEWAFVRAVCPHIPGGEASASKKFCSLANLLLNSIGTSLTTGVSNSISAFQSCIHGNIDELPSKKKAALQPYRDIKALMNESSERARQVITLAKSLRKDLEIAAEFTLLVSGSVLLTKLRKTGHIRVTAPNITGHVLFVPGNLQHCESFIWQLVDMTCGHEALDPGSDQAVYLLMMQCSKTELRGLFWDGPTIILEPSPEENITLSHVEVDGLLLVVNHSSQLISQCKKFQKVMGDTLRISKQETSCSYAIAGALTLLKSEALELWQKLSEVMKRIEEDLYEISLLPSYREVLHQGYKFAFEYHKAVSRLITGEARSKFYVSLASFAEMWMAFVITKCEEGRGLRPMWVKQGLEFLNAVYNSPYGLNLPEAEFEELQDKISRCLSHLVGYADKPFLYQDYSSKTEFFSMLRMRHKWNPCSMSSSTSDSLLSSSPVIGYLRRKGSRDESASKSSGSSAKFEISPIERVRNKVDALERKVQDELYSKKAIGHVSNVKMRYTSHRIGARRVTFPWQRCFKIGEGRFGKVYTAVNNETGELIAMKEIRLPPNDHRAIMVALDEIRISEGIKYPNLVRYYGVEIHREEMLIFMEYCNEGTLESAVHLHLPETLIRKYTAQLVDAVNALHEHGIVHRDIKSANIFLTSDGNIKLGDFGCSIKLKSNTTMPGELCAFVGTPAYMAPEVFTKTIQGGHGRAADVWSLGCVVLEMFTAQIPWHDMESHAILFTVGMGGIPEIPEFVGDEGRDFLNKCLVSNPQERWTTSQLSEHPFTKVQD